MARKYQKISQLAKVSSKKASREFLKLLRYGHTIRPMHDDDDGDDINFRDKHGNYTKAYWDMVKKSRYEINHNIDLTIISSKEELLKYLSSL